MEPVHLRFTVSTTPSLFWDWYKPVSLELTAPNFWVYPDNMPNWLADHLAEHVVTHEVKCLAVVKEPVAEVSTGQLSFYHNLMAVKESTKTQLSGTKLDLLRPLTITVTQVGDYRSEVQIVLSDMVFVSALHHILRRIAKAWPEVNAQEGVKDWLSAPQQLSQTFLFNANAHEVCTHIMGKANWRDENHAVRNVTNGTIAIRAYLSVGVVTNALYSIGFMCWMTPGEELAKDWNVPWIIERAEVAEIGLTQESAGRCRANLYIETSPLRWGSQRTSLWHSGPQLIGKLWNDIVEAWLEKSPLASDGSALSTYSHLPTGPLTDTEVEIAHLLAQGKNDEEISQERVTSASTVATQRKALAKKLGIEADKKFIAARLRALGY